VSRDLLRQIPVFGLVGLASTATHVGGALAARIAFDLPPLAANFAGYLCAVGVSYLGNAWLTFRQPVAQAGQAGRFVLVSLAGLALGQALTWGFTGPLGWPFPAALAVVVLAVAALSFTLSRLWAFRMDR
jgi:putative flippase GtrA